MTMAQKNRVRASETSNRHAHIEEHTKLWHTQARIDPTKGRSFDVIRPSFDPREKRVHDKRLQFAMSRAITTRWRARATIGLVMLCIAAGRERGRFVPIATDLRGESIFEVSE